MTAIEIPREKGDVAPAIRWSHYALAGGGGVAILDRGLTGRELNGRTPVIYLLNAVDKYYGDPNSWLSGTGKRRLEYALVAHECAWEEAHIARMAWEYNSPPMVFSQASEAAPRPFLRTSENVLVDRRPRRRSARRCEV